MVRVNGKEIENIEGKNIGTYLKEAGFDRQKVAVERNGEIVPKKYYDEVIISEADTLEVVSFVGGG